MAYLYTTTIYGQTPQAAASAFSSCNAVRAAVAASDGTVTWTADDSTGAAVTDASAYCRLLANGSGWGIGGIVRTGEADAPAAPASASLSSLQTDVVALQLQVTALGLPKPPTPEIMDASSLMFAAALLAGALIWGLKRVYAIFQPSNDQD